MNSKQYIITFFLLSFIILTTCEESSNEPSDPVSLYPDLGLTRDDTLEAEMIAYFMDQSLTASDSSHERELYLLNNLRLTFRDSFLFVDSVRFFPPWVPDMLLVGVDTLTATQINNGTYSGWDSLPPEMRPDSVGVIGKLGWGRIYPPTGFHPVLLSEYYEQVPGVRYAEPNGMAWVDFPKVPLAIVHGDSGNSYLFARGWPFPTAYHMFEYNSETPFYQGTPFQGSDSAYFAYNRFLDRFMDWGNP